MTMRRFDRYAPSALLACSLLGFGCGNDDGGQVGDDANSGFGDGGTAGDSADGGPGGSGGPDGGGTDDDGSNPGDDDGNPDPPGEGEELCDAGDEAWAKRTIQFIHGRKPASIREVRVLAQMVGQLDAMGEDGREIVARGLARGDVYLDRWKTYLYEELRINRSGDRRNELCYDQSGPESEGTALAAFIRDNTAEAQYPGGDFWMPDVVYSALRLDDLSPAYRANLFAQMSAPLIAGNVNAFQLEEMVRTTHGTTFEIAYLGRNTECLECHRAEFAVTFDANESLNRHWPLPGHLELAVYGEEYAPLANANRSYAIFRDAQFVFDQADIANNNFPNSTPAFGMDDTCGRFRLANPGADPLDHEPYMMTDYSEYPAATVYQLDQELRAGFDTLRANGLEVAADMSVDPQAAGAYLISMNIANHAWREAMGFPLVVANNFPRNPDQRDILQLLANAFVSDSFSLRTLVSTIADHPYFNQAPPATCTASTPYHLPAIFDPFTKSSTIPSARGNGVGDSIHRMGPWVMLDAIAQAMWWNKPDRFGPGTGQTPAFNCGANMPQVPCEEEPEDATLIRDVGAFLSDSDSGFEGTDLTTLLRVEDAFGRGQDPGMHGACTGPLGGACAAGDWISSLIEVAVDTPGADMWDVASAIKDRLITEPAITTQAEANALADLMGVASLDETVADVGAAATEEGARRLVGMLVNTPQFLLVGVASPDQDPAEDPTLVVPGTSTSELCQYLGSLVLDNPDDGVSFGFSCSGDGIQISG